MPALVARTHVFDLILQDVDGRDKPGMTKNDQLGRKDPLYFLRRFTLAIFSSTAQTAAVSRPPSPLFIALR